MRSVFNRAAVIALVGTAAAFTAVGCSTGGDNTPPVATVGGDETDRGAARFNLKLAENAIVDTVHYAIRQGGALIPVSPEFPNLPEGDIPVPGNTTDFVFALELPVGTGYTVELTASWDDPDDVDTVPDIECTNSGGPVEVGAVVANSEIGIHVEMLCRDMRSGDLIVDVDVITEACPDLHMAYAVAVPPQTTIGTPVEVRSAATHDVGGTVITYRWTVEPAIGGSFADEFAANTSFLCATQNEGGLPHRLTITATGGGCDDTLTVPLSCANELCGNNVVDTGETCDDGGVAGGCPDDCTQVCGDGNIEGTETCELPGISHPGTASCNGTTGPGAPCTTRVIVCGDGFIQAPETCDDGNTVTGDGCDFPSCTPTPPPPDACSTCELAAVDCAPLVGACAGMVGTIGTGPAAGTLHSVLCDEVLACARSSNCANIRNTDCYCGLGADVEACLLGDITPSGPCLTSIQRGVGSTNPTAVLSRYIDQAFGGGMAMARETCARSNCAGGVPVGTPSNLVCFVP